LVIGDKMAEEEKKGKIPVQVYDYPTGWEIAGTIVITAIIIFSVGKLIGWF